MKPCEWRPYDAVKNLGYAGCPALAPDGQRFCPAHKALDSNSIPKPPKINRHEFQDADLLPMDHAEFAMLRELREKTK